jgi:hypothetical protein
VTLENQIRGVAVVFGIRLPRALAAAFIDQALKASEGIAGLSAAMRMSNPFRYFNSSPEVIRLVVMLYVRYPLSLRNVDDLLDERGIDVSHETVRFWWNRFGPMFAPRFVSDASRTCAAIRGGGGIRMRFS